MAIDCLDECALGLKEGITPFTEVCIKTPCAFCNFGGLPKQNDLTFYVLDDITKAVGDEADEVRSNGAYVLRYWSFMTIFKSRHMS